MPSGILEGKITDIRILDSYRYVTPKEPDINHKSQLMHHYGYGRVNDIGNTDLIDVNEIIITFRPSIISRDDFIFLIDEFLKISMMKGFLININSDEFSDNSDSKETIVVFHKLDMDHEPYKTNGIVTEDYVEDKIDEMDYMISEISTPNTPLYGLSAKDFYYDIICDIDVWNLDHIIFGG